MKKRILSTLMIVAMLFSLCAVTNITAADYTSFVDYIPGDDGNLITTHPTNYVDINSGEVACPITDNIVTLTANSTVGTSSDWGMQGFEINERFISSLQDGFAPVFDQETKVLISAKVRKAADATANAKINVSYSSWYKNQYEGGTARYTDTYPNAGDGFLVNSTEWMDFTAVMTVPASTDGNTWAYLFGLASGTAKGAKVEVDMKSMYFGAEMPYDIKVTATKTSAKATIVNQIGEVYSGTQGGFSWAAMNADRTAVVEGIEVTDNGDGTAAVSVADTVAAGTYHIVAASDTYAGFVKGAEIEVIPTSTDIPESDYIPADDGNLIDIYPEHAVDINSGEVGCAVSGTTVTLTANSAAGTSAEWGIQGFEINERFISSLQDGFAPVFPQETKVLISAKVRKTADSTVNPKINVSYSSWYKNQYEGGTAQYTDTYPDVGDGFLVNSTEWMDFTAVMTVPASTDGNTWAYLFGLASGTAKGAKVEVDMESMYFGAEMPYDIKVTATKTSAKATIVNQIGEAYSGTQGGFSWAAMNADRTAVVEGIEVTDNGDGTATVNVSDTVEEGTYVIVATSDTYAGFVRGAEIEVTSTGTDVPPDVDEPDKDWSDYVPVPVSNLITTTYPAGNLDINAGEVSAVASGNVTTLSAKSDCNGSADWGLQGFEINKLFISSLPDKNHVPVVGKGEKVIFSVKVRKAADATEDATINVAYASAGEGKAIYPESFPSGTEGLLVDSTEWMEFEVEIPAGENIGGVNWRFVFGFAAGTKVGAKVELDMTSMSMILYKAYDIKITDNSGKAILDPGVATSFTADVIDSDGNAMGGEEVFSWALLNEEKTAVVSGVTFTPDDIDATTVDVVVGNTVTPGNYYLAAESKSGETTGWIKSIPVTVLKPTINDYVAGTVPGEINDITITRTDDGDQTMGLTDTAKFAASVVDSNDELVSGEQNFVWFVMNEIRKDDVTADFTVTPSADTTTATVTPKLSTANGTYYVMAQYADDERIVKAIKIKIDKAQSVVNSANLINDGSSSEIAAQLTDIAVIVEVSDETKAILTESAVKSEAAKILADSFDNENKLSTSDMNAVKSAIEKATVIALYNENPASVTLFDAEGKFAYADELHLAEIDTAGVTLYDVFNTTLSAEGRNAIQTLLKSTQITTINGFEKTLKENIVLYGIKYPEKIGVSYLENILTDKNLAATGIDAPKYLARADKGATHQAIARELYTVEELIAALEKEPTTDNGGGNGGGGGGGGAYTAPIESAPAENEPGETNVQPAYPKFSDVKEEHWAYTDIYYLRERNIINGIDENTFNPNGNITREQFAKILCAALNIETTSANADFTDVDNNAWYAPFIAAVYNKGIVNGVDEKKFGVGANITRQDLCTMIYRALDSEKYSYTALGFTDDANISEYARDAVATLKGLEIVNGYNDGSFNPQGLCTRAEAAKIICKLFAITEVLK